MDTIQKKERNMKMTIAAVGMALALTGGAALAADGGHAGHCREGRSQACGQDMAAMSQHDHAGHGAMQHDHGASTEKLPWSGMSKHMVPMMKTVSGMSQRLSDAMAAESAGARMSELGGLMDEMSSHLLRMADAMNNGGATEAEMHSIHMGLDETSKKVEKIK